MLFLSLCEANCTFISDPVGREREKLKRVFLSNARLIAAAPLSYTVVVHHQALEMSVVLQAGGKRNCIVHTKPRVVQIKKLKFGIVVKLIAEPECIPVSNVLYVLRDVQPEISFLLISASPHSRRPRGQEQGGEQCEMHGAARRERRTGVSSQMQWAHRGRIRLRCVPQRRSGLAAPA